MCAAIYPPAALSSPCVLRAGIKLGSRAAAWGITFYSNTDSRGKFPGLVLALWHCREGQCPGGTTRVSGHTQPGWKSYSVVLDQFFSRQQSSYFWLSELSHECPAWAVCVKWHLHGPVSLNRVELVMQLRFGKEKCIWENWLFGLKGDGLQSVSLGNSLWLFCWDKLCFFPLQIWVCIMNKDPSSFAASSKLLCH